MLGVTSPPSPQPECHWIVPDFFIGFLLGLGAVLLSAAVWKVSRLGRRKGSRAPASRINHESFITSMKAVGELNVFRIMTKEVITASDHWLGEFGQKYLNWLLSSQRITLVIEFDVDFRYDLTDPAFGITEMGEDAFLMTMPPCRHEVRIRDMRIHSEDSNKLLPWLMPDLLNRFFSGGFSVEAKNKLISETRAQASRFAGELVERTTAEAQRSATLTLGMLAQGLGATRVDFDFTEGGDFKPKVDTTALEEIVADPGQLREGGF
jgi:hypothetical protein